MSDLIADKPSWWVDKIVPIIVTILLSSILTTVGTIVYTTGGKIVTSGETTVALSIQVQELKEQNRNQIVEIKDNSKLLQDIYVKQGAAYTRDEAQRALDQITRLIRGIEERIDATTRRLETMDNRLGTFESRLNALEVQQRISSQYFLDQNKKK